MTAMRMLWMTQLTLSAWVPGENWDNFLSKALWEQLRTQGVAGQLFGWVNK